VAGDSNKILHLLWAQARPVLGPAFGESKAAADVRCISFVVAHEHSWFAA
jgi:hypothetical protein